MIQTTAELDSERRAKLELAAKYEALLGQRVQLKRTIEGLESQQVNLNALRRIHELTGDVPPSIVTKSTGSLGWSVPADMDVRSVLMQVAGGALSRATDREAERVALLTKAQITLAAVEVELSELERTNA